MRVCEQARRLTLARFFVKLTAVYPKYFFTEITWLKKVPLKLTA